jgi:hypothetical protein
MLHSVAIYIVQDTRDIWVSKVTGCGLDIRGEGERGIWINFNILCDAK